jgi:hypothetical protein
MHEHYLHLMNWVDARNLESIKWLDWCGFDIEEAKPYGEDAISAAQSIAGSAVGAFAAEKQYDATKESIKYSQDIINRNQEIAQMKADDALARGREKASSIRGQVRQLVGAQRAAAAGSGVLATSGSPLQAQQQAQYLGDMDALTVMNNAQKEAWGHRMDIANMQTQWNVLQSQKYWAKWSKNFGTAASLMGAGSKFGGQMFQYYGGGQGGGAAPNYGGGLSSTGAEFDYGGELDI